MLQGPQIKLVLMVFLFSSLKILSSFLVTMLKRTDKFLNIIEYVLHNPESNNEYQINFIFYSLLDLKV